MHNISWTNLKLLGSDSYFQVDDKIKYTYS